MNEKESLCYVRVINGETNTCIYVDSKEINYTELEAIKASREIYCNNRYNDIKKLVFNYDDLTLEIII